MRSLPAEPLDVAIGATPASPRGLDVVIGVGPARARPAKARR
jgi:hypothetical protein